MAERSSDPIDANNVAVASESNTAESDANTTSEANYEGLYSDQHHIDAECEKLLRNTKKQVKQMMEEAVTKKFIHEESSSIISLCVAVDACLTHGLKRRALGLFKTNSSTALIQKVAKCYKCAQEVLDVVEDEERRILSEQHKAANAAAVNQQQENTSFGRIAQTLTKSPVKQQVVASNPNVHKRNMWIKWALIEKKLVDIVDYLSMNANKYYETDALLSNYLCAQILSSLLVGPSALEFSRSKTNDYYLFEEPSADELLKRHNLTNPIACLCTKQPSPTLSHQQLARSHTDSQHRDQVDARQVRSVNSLNVAQNDGSLASEPQCNLVQQQVFTGNRQSVVKDSSLRRKPLALKTNVKSGGTLVTDCHHYSCQEMSEHQQTRGYSFLSSSSLVSTASSPGASIPCSAACSNGHSQADCNPSTQQADWALWSPRMLHETLHQNSKSSLLYAKNNVLLETQPSQTMAGYLSLHQTSNDLFLKWIPNQMINGGQITPINDGEQSEIMKRSDCGESHSTLVNSEKGRRDSLSSNAVESSYLDLVVNLSVSRIVLLHCQFGKRRRIPTESSSSLENACCNTDERLGVSANQVEAHDSMKPSNRFLRTEETLILIEADGVQRSPFKFPKGGLRVFLSCLENGLLPNRYLDPAIRFDDSSPPGDPTNELIGERSPLCTETSSKSCTDDGSGTNRIVTASRFDSFLRRLPSLKQKPAEAQSKAPNSETSCENSAPSNEDPQADGTDVQASQTSSNIPERDRKYINKLPTNNYVYRIVSAQQQADWPQQTPPHSAISVGSSSSGSFGLMSQQNYGCATKQVGSSQKFRWSLGKLTRFSARYTHSGSSSSSLTANMLGNHSTGTLPNGSLASLANHDQTKSNSVSESNNFSTSSADFSSLLAGDIAKLEPELASLGSIDNDTNGTNRWDQRSVRELARIEEKLQDLKESNRDDDEMQALRTQSIQTLCDSMRKQIISRAFNGWLVHCRKAKIIRAHLKELIKEQNELIDEIEDYDQYEKLKPGLTRDKWNQLMASERVRSESDLSREINQLVYYGGIESDELRKEVWPYLLEHYKFKEGPEERRLKDETVRDSYEACQRDWIKIERVVKQRDSDILAANMARVSNRSKLKASPIVKDEETDKLVDSNNNNNNSNTQKQELDSCLEQSQQQKKENPEGNAELAEMDTAAVNEKLEVEEDDDEDEDGDESESVESLRAVSNSRRGSRRLDDGEIAERRRRRRRRRARLESTGSVGSDASITDQFGNNIHRIDKDVQRCDRNFWYFKETKNLDKLRNIMCCYVWEHLDVGYVQGMCDLAAPFLVIFDDEVLSYSCFSQLMKRMVANFPHGSAMDQHFERLKHLMQVLDPKLFDVLQSNGDYTHFYFCYRWLLLDFKRELTYEDVYRVWETIWSARYLVTEHFVVFMALAMVRYYRDIIIENNMDFTDTIKFFNEMAERHDATRIIALARDCIVELQALIKT